MSQVTPHSVKEYDDKSLQVRRSSAEPQRLVVRPQCVEKKSERANQILELGFLCMINRRRQRRVGTDLID